MKSESFENSLLTTTSTGNNILTFLLFAFSYKSFAKSILSSSNKLLPTEYPKDFKNVNAIPPPIIILSTFSIKFSITVILSDTFAPPKIATKGLSGLERAFPIIEISFSTKNPTADGKNLHSPTFEQ